MCKQCIDILMSSEKNCNCLNEGLEQIVKWNKSMTIKIMVTHIIYLKYKISVSTQNPNIQIIYCWIDLNMLLIYSIYIPQCLFIVLNKYIHRLSLQFQLKYIESNNWYI